MIIYNTHLLGQVLSILSTTRHVKKKTFLPISYTIMERIIIFMVHIHIYIFNENIDMVYQYL